MKPIIVTNDTHAKIMELFGKYLQENRSQNGKIEFKMELSDVFALKKTRIKILMTPLAYLKMNMLVQNSSVEIAWHGTVERVNKTTFRILDVLCYPQEVASTTVTSDDKKYPQWLMELDDDTINSLRFQGHSHVRMGVSPSGVDTNNWDEILQSLPANSYYIFCIANKTGDIHWCLYDLEHNILYENTDIDFAVEMTPPTKRKEAYTFKDWVEDNTKQHLTQRTYQASAYTKTTPPAEIKSHYTPSLSEQYYLEERYGYGAFDTPEPKYTQQCLQTSYIKNKVQRGGKK